MDKPFKIVIMYVPFEVEPVNQYEVMFHTLEPITYVITLDRIGEFTRWLKDGAFFPYKAVKSELDEEYGIWNITLEADQDALKRIEGLYGAVNSKWRSPKRKKDK